jgi:hypothetical protein
MSRRISSWVFAGTPDQQIQQSLRLICPSVRKRIWTTIKKLINGPIPTVPTLGNCPATTAHLMFRGTELAVMAFARD